MLRMYCSRKLTVARCPEGSHWNAQIFSAWLRNWLSTTIVFHGYHLVPDTLSFTVRYLMVSPSFTAIVLSWIKNLPSIGAVTFLHKSHFPCSSSDVGLTYSSTPNPK
uniref:(northern house mosquito) hypothetical protein n=1 Tax=Culex pipiens TaxID=7175 RepID=A0A8D8ICG9_CULPI